MPWRYAEPPYTSMPSYRMTDIRFAIGGIGAGAGRQRRRPLHRSISRHSGHPVTSPSTTPPPSAATRPECAAQPSYAVVTNRAIPPIRNNRPRNCATTPGVSRQIRPDAHHGSTQDPWPKHPLNHPSWPPTDSPRQRPPGRRHVDCQRPHPAEVPSKASETGLSRDGAHAATDLK